MPKDMFFIEEAVEITKEAIDSLAIFKPSKNMHIYAAAVGKGKCGVAAWFDENGEIKEVIRA